MLAIYREILQYHVLCCASCILTVFEVITVNTNVGYGNSLRKDAYPFLCSVQQYALH